MNKEKNKALSLQIEAPESVDDKQQASDGSDEKNAEGRGSCVHSFQTHI